MSFWNVGQVAQLGEALAAAACTDAWRQSCPQDAA